MNDEPSITCPRCKRTSYHPGDIEHGYCGWCHWWTSDPAGMLNTPETIAQAEADGAITPLPRITADFEAWQAGMRRSIKRVFVLAFFVEIGVIAFLIQYRQWFFLPIWMVALFVLCGGRYLIWRQDHGKLGAARDT